MLIDFIGEVLASLNGLPPDRQREQLLRRRAEILAEIADAPWILQHVPGVPEFRSILERIDAIAAPDLPPLLRSLSPWPRTPGPGDAGATRAGGIGLPHPSPYGGGPKEPPRSLNPWPGDDDGDGGDQESGLEPYPRDGR